MKQAGRIILIVLVATAAAGCNDLYTEVIDRQIIPVAPSLLPYSAARRVYGQLGSFTTNYINNGNVLPGTNSLFLPSDVAVSADGVYVVDNSNNRVLFYAGTSTTASRVYGQSGSFTSMASNNGGISANSLNSPAGVTVDAGGVYIADADNNRVLYYADADITASRVYGQDGGFTTNGSNHGGLGPASLSGPVGVAVDADGVYIADAGNNRVLYYSGTDTTAARVYGQDGSFITNDENKGGVGADSLNHPNSIALDENGAYISDNQNNRVLYYTGTSTTASRVYGQFGSFISNTLNNGGISADSLFRPNGLAVAANGLYISDHQNNRVLYYPGSSTTAARVYGQSGSFTSNNINNGTPLFPSATSLSGPMGLAVDTSGLYIVDAGNNRVLWY
ncbi:MAG: NHL repeat-containing protein [Spirochaetes bacterium]|nr:NHL repeat-containing protein [Spirochaetota bacterium]